MTEAEWLAATDPKPMISFLRNRRLSDRKWRLFAVGCCRQILNQSVDLRLQGVVEVSERYADKMATKSELSAALKRVQRVRSRFEKAHVTNGQQIERMIEPGNAPPLVVATLNILGAVETAAYQGIDGVMCVPSFARRAIKVLGAELKDQVKLLRDIFPFRPLSFDPSWRTSTVSALAQTMYDFRDFSAMPILADALQDAGCDNEEMLAHCRDPKPVHVRGCWVVDAVLQRQ